MGFPYRLFHCTILVLFDCIHSSISLRISAHIFIDSILVTSLSTSFCSIFVATQGTLFAPWLFDSILSTLPSRFFLQSAYCILAFLDCIYSLNSIFPHLFAHIFNSTCHFPAPFQPHIFIGALNTISPELYLQATHPYQHKYPHNYFISLRISIPFQYHHAYIPYHHTFPYMSLHHVPKNRHNLDTCWIKQLP